MRKVCWHTLGCMVLLHLFCFPALGQTTVAELRIEGQKNVSTDKIRRIVRIDPGDAFSAQTVTEAMKRLYATKEFADVQAFQEERDGQIILTIVVQEYPKIEKVRFEGNKRIKDDELTEVISVKKGAFVRPALLRKDHAAIEDMYREKGYYRVSVTNRLVTDTEKKTKRKVDALVYEISEGEKVSIKHIDFFGNLAVDSGRLRKVMQSKEDRWYRGADFKPSVLEEDLLRIVQGYREYGYLDAEIVDKELVFSEDGRGLDIFITVKEGPQYEVGKITWRGNEIFGDAAIASAVTFETGDVFNDNEFTNIQIAMNSLYWDRGYIYNSITPEKTVRGTVIDVEFEITEGEPAHVHEINITGNTKTSEKVIRRELIVHPGDVFVRPRLIRSLREVFNLGFFNGPPEVGTSQANDDGDINIDLKVQEKQTGQFRLGAGFSALNSISGFIGLAETNFLGRGQTVGIDWEFSRTRQNLDLRFTEPWLFGTPTQLSVNVFNRVQDQVSQQFYDDRRRGVSVRVGRPFPWFDYTTLFWRYSYESIELSNFSPIYVGPLLNIAWPQVTSSMGLTLVRNSVDSPFRPTTGSRAAVTADIAGGFLAGDVQFQSYDLAVSWYQNLFWKFVFEMGFRAGVLDGFGKNGAVPDYERFRLGGNRALGVRGYDFFEIVPEGNPPFLGGRYMHIFTYEVTMPLSPNIYALGFFDAGNTWNNVAGADVFDLRKGVGIGIRMELPMLGVLGFDYGYGFDKRTGAAWEPHLTLGGSF